MPEYVVAVLQSNYLPWKGYFDLIHDVDLFIFYDDVQFTKNDWRNRNRVHTASGELWLTVPVGQSIDRRICDVEIANTRHWQEKHWRTISQIYGKSPFFKRYSGFFEELYRGRVWRNLSEINQYIVKHIAIEYLGITTKFDDSRNYKIEGKKQDRLLNLLQQTGATRYISGPAARDYIDESRFNENKIGLSYKDYAGYPEYRQFYPPFDHHVSIIDLLFLLGPDAPHYIWGWRNRQ